MKEKGYEKVLPWDAQAMLRVLRPYAAPEKAQMVSTPQAGNDMIATLDPYKGFSAHGSVTDLQKFSTPLWPKYTAAPEHLAEPLSSCVVV